MYYVVRVGRKPGIYSSWDDARVHVDGFKGAEYRKFNNETDANIYLNGGNVRGKYVYAVRNDNKVFFSWEECKKHVEGMKGAEFRKFKSEHEANKWLAGRELTTDDGKDIDEGLPTFYIDGAHRDGKISFGVVLVNDGKETTYRGQTEGVMGNISGEIAALVFALHITSELGFKSINVVYDYDGIKKWATGEYKTNQDEARRFKVFVDTFLLRNNVDIHYYKCKSHSGNTLNNKADSVAKQALIDGKMYTKEALYSERLL